jgi:hypothetical protein
MFFFNGAAITIIYQERQNFSHLEIFHIDFWMIMAIPKEKVKQINECF